MHYHGKCKDAVYGAHSSVKESINGAHSSVKESIGCGVDKLHSHKETIKGHGANALEKGN